MAILVGGILLAMWAALILAAPRHRGRAWPRRRRAWATVGDGSIDGEENSASSAFVGGDAGGDAGAAGCGDGGGSDGGGGGGGDGGSCGD